MDGATPYSLRSLLANALQDAAYSAHMEVGLALTPEPCVHGHRHDGNVDCPRHRMVEASNVLLERDADGATWVQQADALIDILRTRFHVELDPEQIDEDEPTRRFTRDVLRRDPDTDAPLP